MIHSKTSEYLKTLFLALFIFLAIAGLSFYTGPASQAVNDPTTINLLGYAWSDNVGWISLNCINTGTCAASNYKVTMSDGGDLSGYAWSDSIGWLSFTPGDLAGCPSAPCAPRLNRYFGAGQGTIAGWMKALSGGTLGSGGWDGFVSLSGTNGVNAGTYPNGNGSNGTLLGGYAWGSDVVGWVNFSSASADSRLVCVQGWKQACASNTNSCGLRNYGLIQCDGTCNVTFPPAESRCSDEATGGGTVNVGGACEKLTANPKFVGRGGSTTLSWDGSCQSNSCTLYHSESGNLVSTSTTGSLLISGLTERRTYVLSCTADVTITVGPSFEFKEF
ncbi:hypothetical protein KW797_03895 [Candidatus Parcubacteria bacterium]|nr:hypothetical protein [Candidatus Parcubacteria bacterium]